MYVWVLHGLVFTRSSNSSNSRVIKTYLLFQLMAAFSFDIKHELKLCGENTKFYESCLH